MKQTVEEAAYFVCEEGVITGYDILPSQGRHHQWQKGEDC